MKFALVEPKIAGPKRCRWGDQCRRPDRCNMDHTEYPPVVIKEDTTTYFLETRSHDRDVFTVLRRTLEENNFIRLDVPKEQVVHHNVTLLWGTVYPKYPLPKSCIINHFPNSHQLTSKNRMSINLASNFDYLPKSFNLPEQLQEFQEHQDQNIWICKPVAKGCGHEVRVVTRQELMNDYNPHKNPEGKSKRVVVSEYIRNPLLIDDKKVDMRMYVLLKNGDSIFLYDDAIVRSASEAYSNNVDTLNNSFIHITNNSINNKKILHEKIQMGDQNNCYGFYGNKSYKELIKNLNVDPSQQLHDLVRCAVNATIYNKKYEDELSDIGDSFRTMKHRCFELLGFDVLFDENMKPYLLEVNGMPDLNGMSKNGFAVIKVDFDIKSRMFAECMNIVFSDHFELTGFTKL
ncbi:hypothetical protein AKO1_011623 [Acrasis kona]|uniref:Tubulin--tyrosine ligase-like protein 5 n=1 Tax=Acrasis kona TaxID=1008807 RepID=A0AAW2Z583_9EUKA